MRGQGEEALSQRVAIVTLSLQEMWVKNKKLFLLITEMLCLLSQMTYLVIKIIDKIDGACRCARHYFKCFVYVSVSVLNEISI